MKQTVNKYDFINAFVRAGRKDQFSRCGLEALFEYLEEFEQGGEEIELDVVAICCDFSEYDSANEAAEEMISGYEKPEREEGETDEDYSERVQECALEQLHGESQVISDYSKNSVIVAAF